MGKISEQGLQLIRHYETLHDGDLSKIGLQPKLCPSGYVTYGYGHTVSHDGQMMRSIEYANKLFPNIETITEEEAEQMLKEDMVKEEAKVNKNITVKLKQCQFDALVSYFYNIGYSNTMVSLVNEGALDNEIYEWFTEHYITGNGVFLKGLLYRRKSEAELYTTGQLKFYNA